MNVIHHKPNKKQLTPQQFAAKPVIALFKKSHSEIWHSARLLGGFEASRLVDQCVGALEQDAAITNRVRIMLDQILKMLSLDEVDDPNQHFMAYFAVIDPLDPVVEEICLLTDSLRAAIEEAAERKTWALSQVRSPQAA